MEQRRIARGSPRQRNYESNRGSIISDTLKTNLYSNGSHALTIIEVIVIIVGLMMLAVIVVVRALNPPHCGIPQWINCLNNLHQIGLADKTWALDNLDNYATEVSITNGGAREFALAGNVAKAFEVMSNELNTPKVLICPVDAGRSQATLFNSTLSNRNVSYFMAIDASDSLPNMFLAGDRNITTNGVQLTPGVHLLRTNALVGWTSAIHKNSGNILIVDGSAMQWNNAAFRTALVASGTSNRVAVP